MLNKIKVPLEISLLAIIVTLTVLILAIRFGNQSNPINRHLRKNAINSIHTRKLLNLDQVGDAKSDYLSSDSEEILVEVHFQNNYQPAPEIINWITETILVTTGKKANFIWSDKPTIPSRNSHTQNQLYESAKKSRKHATSKNQAFLQVIYVSRFKDIPSYTGIVFSSDTLFVFVDAMEDLTKNLENYQSLEKSTIMHEFGHLLGLDHVPNPECIMSEFVEVPETWEKTSKLPETFCPETLFQLKTIKESL